MDESSEDKETSSEADYESDYYYEDEDNNTTRSFLRDDAAAAATMTLSSSTHDDLFLRSQPCPRCHQEGHDPVSCCTQVANWVHRRHQLWTVSPQVLQKCVAHYNHTVAIRANINEVEAGIWCRNAGWQVDLSRIRPNRDDHLEVAQMRERYMKQVMAPYRAYDRRGNGNNERDDPMNENGARAAAVAAAASTPPQMQLDADLKLPAQGVPKVPNLNKIEDETRNVAVFLAPNPPAPAVAIAEKTDEVATLEHDHKAFLNYLLEAVDAMADPTAASVELDGNIASNVNTNAEGKQLSINQETKTHTQKPVLLTCRICLEDDLPLESMYAMGCGHAFCLECWRHHVVTILSETHEVAMHATCPEPDCNHNIDEVLIQAVAPECMPRFEHHQRQAFVLGRATTLRWCPGPDCDQVAILPRDNMFEDNVKDFCCGICSTSFCFTCGKTPHDGICEPDAPLAEHLPEVAAAARVRALHDTRDDKLRKHCPYCKVPVEKNGGCNRMVCRCGHAFCWLCLGDYTDYGGHYCGRPDPQRPLLLDHGRATVDLEFLKAALLNNTAEDELVQKTTLALQELELYAHCYNRYNAHRQGQEYAEGQCPCIENRKELYTQMAGFQSGNEVDFIQSAHETLVVSRRMLKYAYISVFHSKRVDDKVSTHAQLGFLHLERLERFTEELSGISENALTRRDRAKVLNLISIVKRCMKELADFEFEDKKTSSEVDYKSDYSYCEDEDIDKDKETSSEADYESDYTFCEDKDMNEFSEDKKTSNEADYESDYSFCEDKDMNEFSEDQKTSNEADYESDYSFCEDKDMDESSEDKKTSSEADYESDYSYCEDEDMNESWEDKRTSINRYNVHRQGQEYAEGQCPCVENRKNIYTPMADFRMGTEADLIQSANETLVASRRLIKYANAYVFHRKRVDDKDSKHSQLGLFHLQRLEHFTEELSRISENAVTHDDRVLGLIAVVRRYTELLTDFVCHEYVANASE